jgi:hypothetical protein
MVVDRYCAGQVIFF